MPIMNPSPTDIIELFRSVEFTLVQCATIAGHHPGVAAAEAKVKPKRVNKVEVAQEEPSKEDAQACAVTPRAKSKGPNRSTPPPSLLRSFQRLLNQKRAGKGRKENLKGKLKSDDNS